MVLIVVGKHKMKTITHIVMTIIILYKRIGDKLKIDAIPVAADIIIPNRNGIAFPGVNTVTNLVF